MGVGRKLETYGKLNSKVKIEVEVGVEIGNFKVIQAPGINIPIL